MGDLNVTLEGELGVFKASLTTRTFKDGVDEIVLKLISKDAEKPPVVRLRWKFPCIGVAAMWHPSLHRRRGLMADWQSPLMSSSTCHAPVLALHGFDGTNRITFACSDALNHTDIMAGLIEETGEFDCYVNLLRGSQPPIKEYEAILRIDRRTIDYSQALQDVASWWASMPGYTPARVPPAARMPMYSTWYSFHQHVDPDAIVEQCRLAKKMCCEAVIVDDGWQTNDGSRGYAFCGDWEAVRVPQMRQFVDRVHKEGLKFLLWYSVPFVGTESKLFAKFEGKYLSHDATMKASVLDPRFPDVREHLITLYEKALREWDLDGFKLDFVDSFRPSEHAPVQAGGDRDYASVYAASDRLMSDIITRLQRIKPDVMIEFRQSYTGPLMRKYGNIFRAADCPADAMTNRIRTIDVRLLSGTTAVHSDMLMWNKDEPVETAALQILNILFSVPQLSVRFDQLSPRHLQMVEFWMNFFVEHRQLLLEGKLKPANPEGLYPWVMASDQTTQIIVVYDQVVPQVDLIGCQQLYIVNATPRDRVVVRLEQGVAAQTCVIMDCCGKVIETRTGAMSAGLNDLPIPPSGMAIIK